MSRDNLGAYEVEHVDFDATTTAAGEAAFDPEGEAGFNEPAAVEVVAKDAAAKAYEFHWAREGDYFHVVDAADGTDAADATDVGVVTVRIEGRR